MSIEIDSEGNSAPKFRAVELKVPSLAKVEDGEIFDVILWEWFLFENSI